jgi:hypothetical protein
LTAILQRGCSKASQQQQQTTALLWTLIGEKNREKKGIQPNN